MPPPSNLADPPSKRVRLVVSSADRNLSTFPSPSNYTVTFDEPFVDVVSITLLNAAFPLAAYQVCASNNQLAFKTVLDGQEYTAEIPPGDYEPPANLADQVAASMNAACGVPGLFKVEYVPRLDAFGFSSSTPFQLLFDGGTVAFGPQVRDEFGNMTPMGIVETVQTAGERTIAYAKESPARIMGFGPRTYSSAPSASGFHTVVSEFRRDVSHTQTAIVCIDGADVNVSVNNTYNRSYAIIGPKQTAMEAWLPDRNINKNFNPPMGKLAKLRVRVYDVFGNFYNCNNADHRLEFLLTCTPRYQSRPNWTVRAD